jgi:heat shock protein 90kDa beta
MLSQFIVVI